MEEGQVRRQDATPMRSLVNWALLGLVIERPSYAYELAQRFERTFGDALSLSSISHVYTALGTLKDRELVEEMPGTREGRQPKPHYRATEHGIGEYESWLAGQIDEDRQRQRIFVSWAPSLREDPHFALAAPAQARTGRQAARSFPLCG
jgi:DNA-binding PadR family transcriptional regulator